MRTARSCAFECAFCRFPVVAGALNLTDLSVVEKEMRQLHESGVRNLIVIDDTFNVPFPRFKKLLRMMIENRFEFNWFSYFRCSNSDDEGFDLMAQSGCKGTFLGIESGDQRILENMNKHASVEKYRNGIRQLTQRGILSFASFVVGFPGETRESVAETIQFIEDSEPTYFFPELYYHAENLPIQERATEFGLRSAGYSWRHDTMDWRQAADAVDEMILNVTSSTLLPPYMFSFWALPYLMGHGLSLEQIEKFAIAAAPLVKSNIRGSGETTKLENDVVATVSPMLRGSSFSRH
jgi:p-methyltransferase